MDCPVCGKPLSAGEDQAICPHCGHAFALENQGDSAAAEKRPSKHKLVVGIFFMLAGIVSIICGIVQNDDLERRMEAVLAGRSANPGTVWIIVGAIVLVVGVILLVWHFEKAKQD